MKNSLLGIGAGIALMIFLYCASYMVGFGLYNGSHDAATRQPFIITINP